MTLSTIKVAVVDDQPLLVSAFSALVDAQPDMEVVLEAVNGREAVDRLSARARDSQGSTDLVLMDLRMPVLDGISAIRELRAAPVTASLRVLVLTTFDDEDLVLAALGAGASGFLLKDAEPTTPALRRSASSPAVGPGWIRPSQVPFWPISIRVLMRPQVRVRMLHSSRPRQWNSPAVPHPLWGRRRAPMIP